MNPRFIRLSKVVAITAAAALALTGCSSANTSKSADTKTPASSAPAADATGFPMKFKNADGSTTEIPAPPKRVVSTAVTITGYAIPFKAPIVASATAINGKFFPAWAKDADEMKIQKLWKAQEPANLEAVTAAKPDLIIVGFTGADSVRKQMADLQKIAPTILINYSTESWQDVTKQLGKVMGMSAAADKVVSDFDAQVKQVAGSIKHPDGEVNIISYNGTAKPSAVAKVDGPYGELFQSLGFKVEGPNPNWGGGTEQGSKARKDFAFASLENLTSLKAGTTFLIHGDDATAKEMMENPVLANVPSVKAKQVYALGKEVFRLDYYTSQIVLKAVEKQFKK